MHTFYLKLLVLSAYTINASIYSNLKHNVLSILDTPRSESKDGDSPLRRIMNYLQNKKQNDLEVNTITQNKENIRRQMPFSKLSRTAGSEERNLKTHDIHIDPELNSLKNRRLAPEDKERTISSEVEMEFWKADFDEKWTRQKFEAVNSTEPRGDVVNMKLSRPWGVQCGDPNQHDMPWGSCLLPAECEGEYRIYRGDFFCGRSQFICCSLTQTTYDMYQGVDMSFEPDDSLSTDIEDTDEMQSSQQRDRKRKYRNREKKRKKRNRALLKKKIRYNIKRIVVEITKMLQKAYRNATAQQNNKKKELVSFIKEMKKQYRKDRKTLVDAHDIDAIKYDLKMEDNLKKIRGVNQAYMNNDTFRDIVINGTVNKDKLMELKRSNPMLSLFYESRRMGGGDLEPGMIRPENKENEPGTEKEQSEEDELETDKENSKLHKYDLEYGMLYY